MQKSTLSLREQRRLDTLRALHLAAARLVDERGFAEATIDDIVDAAGVSRRTFFNYFPCKEDAVLGKVPPEVSAEALAVLQDVEAEPNRLTRVVRFMYALNFAKRNLITTLAERRATLRAHPELRIHLEQHTQATHELVRGVLREHLTDPQGQAPPLSDPEALALIHLAIAAMRFTYEQDPEAFEAGELDTALNTFPTLAKALL